MLVCPHGSGVAGGTSLPHSTYTATITLQRHASHQVVLTFADSLPGPAEYALLYAPAAFRDTYGNGVLAESSGRRAYTTLIIVDCTTS